MMVRESELITFLVGVGVVLFIWLNRRRISQIPGSTWLIFSYIAMFAGWSLTLAEGLVLSKFLNTVEHFCYMASSAAAAVWCWIVLFNGEDAR